MKKIIVLFMLLLVAVFVVACGADTPAQTTAKDTTAAITTPLATNGTTPVTTTKSVTTTPDAPVVTTPPKGEQLVAEDYTVVLNGKEWVKPDIDTSKYDMIGTGVSAVTQINAKYGGYKKNYVLVNAAGEKTEVSNTEVRKLGTIGVVVTEDKTGKKVDIEVHELVIEIQSSWIHVTAKAGTYLMFDFNANLPIDFVTTVTAEKGGAASTAAYKQDGIYVTEKDGVYTGVAKCQVPYSEGSTMYINISIDGISSEPLVSIPLVITPMKYDSPFRLKIEGDWELIERKDYVADLVELFYNVYPRIYERFGEGDPNVPMTITFKADKNSDSIAYNAGTLIAVQTTWANGSPYDIGFFAHELGHAVQQYGGKMAYESDSWWTEFMADYIRYRYFHWGYSTKFVRFHDYENDKNIYEWGEKLNGYAKHSHNLFGAYMDYMWPTVKNDDGTITYGLIDTINKVIKASDVLLYDHPKDKDNLFNQTVKAVTGYDCMEDIRLLFAKEIQEGTWRCDGFADYKDTFLTEDIPGLPNPVYPMNEPVAKGDKTSPVLETPITEGTNIAKGATIVSTSSQGGTRNPVANLLDGDLDTLFQGAKVTNDYKYELGGYKHEVVIDLGESKKFDTYTLVNAGSKSNNKINNTSEWELFVSEDGKTWTSVDYQDGNKADIASVNVGDTTARYVKLRIFTTDSGANVGTVRLYEFMLFDQQ